MSTENKITVEDATARLQECPLAEVPITLFLNNTEPHTRKVTPSGNMIIAPATWQNPLGAIERVVMLGSRRVFGYSEYQQIFLDFYHGQIQKESSSLAERIYENYLKAYLFPAHLEFTLSSYQPYQNHPLELQIHFGAIYDRIPLGYRPEQTNWILERVIEAAKLAGRTR